MKKRIGFLVCGIGNGHITQAKTVYQILCRNNHEVPVVCFCAPRFEEEWVEMFPGTTCVHHYIPVTKQDMNDFSVSSLWRFGLSIFTPCAVERIVHDHRLDMFMNFWTPNLVTRFSVPCICIASQYNADNYWAPGSWALWLLIHLFKHHQTPVSIGEPNEFSNLWVPSLIDFEPLTAQGRSLLRHRHRVVQGTVTRAQCQADRRGRELLTRPREREDCLCVAYCVSGTDFPERLQQIALCNPSFQVHLFCSDKSAVARCTAENITWHQPSRKDFKDYMRKASCVLCTAGNELIQECILGGTPVATMPCSQMQFEQVGNYNKYVNRLKFAATMNTSIDLEELSFGKASHARVEKANNKFCKSLSGRDHAVLALVSDSEDAPVPCSHQLTSMVCQGSVAYARVVTGTCQAGILLFAICFLLL